VQGSTNGFIARYSATTAQANVSANTVVALSSTDVDNDGNVALVANTITLQPGTYSLRGSIGEIGTTVNPGDGRDVSFGFWNNTTSSWIGTGGFSVAASSGLWEAGPTEASAAITVAVPTQIQLRVNSVSNIGIGISGGGATSLWTQPSLTRAFVTVERR
jgi:hypothetical protein